jgi:hypothetical protein
VNSLGRVNDVLVELHMTFVPVNFITMDMESKISSPIFLVDIFGELHQLYFIQKNEI